MAINDYYRSLKLLTATKTPNGKGGFSEVWVEAETIQGLINQASSKEIFAASQNQMDIDSKLYIAVDTFQVYDATGNRIEYKVKDSIEGEKTYRLVSTPKDTANKGHHWKILVKRIDTDV